MLDRTRAPFYVSLATFDPIPPDADAVLDPGWLAAALDVVGEGDRIVAVDRVDESRTIADKLRFSVTVEGAGSAVRTHHLCAKGHFHPGPSSMLGEASYYRHLQPHVTVRSPRSHNAGVDPASHRGLVVMDDVIALGGRILDAREP